MENYLQVTHRSVFACLLVSCCIHKALKLGREGGVGWQGEALFRCFFL